MADYDHYGIRIICDDNIIITFKDCEISPLTEDASITAKAEWNAVEDSLPCAEKVVEVVCLVNEGILKPLSFSDKKVPWLYQAWFSPRIGWYVYGNDDVLVTHWRYREKLPDDRKKDQ